MVVNFCTHPLRPLLFVYLLLNFFYSCIFCLGRGSFSGAFFLLLYFFWLESSGSFFVTGFGRFLGIPPLFFFALGFGLRWDGRKMGMGEERKEEFLIVYEVVSFYSLLFTWGGDIVWECCFL
ncbi:hypothetical protein K440DRAFT_87531 [Wilcoxina mikolae CBS 423.85]|nr:hypothetical protein K440DRAFT_87531 [Wilcoxina mikolae CBS 423.85]